MSATEVSPYGAAGGSGGSPSADELRAQIEQQRSALGRDLEVLGDKVSPGRMVERRREAVRQSARGFKDKLMGARDTATSRVGDTAGSVGSSVTGVGSSVTGAIGSVGETIGSAPQATMQAAQGAPIAVGLVAFGAGAILAAMLPTSQKERQLAQQATPALQRAAEGAGTIAREGMDQVKEELAPAAQEAAEHLKSTAQDAAQQVKDQASSATEEVRGTAQGATEEVKGAAQSGQPPQATPTSTF